MGILLCVASERLWIHLGMLDTRTLDLTGWFFQELYSMSKGPCPSLFSVASMSVNDAVRAHIVQFSIVHSAVSWRLERK